MRSSWPPLLLAALTATSWARAQPSPPPAPPTREALDEARRHFERGIARLEDDDPAGAVDELQRAYDLSRRPTVLYDLGVALQALRRDAEALDALRRYLAQAERIPRRRRRRVEAAVRELEASQAHVTFEVTPPYAAVRVDGRALGAEDDVALAPGAHHLEVSCEGHRPVDQELSLSAGERRAVRLALTPDPAPPPRVIVVTPPPAPPPPTASLHLDGAPSNAGWTIDGEPHPIVGEATLPRGPHTIEVHAEGHLPWQGSVMADGRTRLHVSLAPRPSGDRTLSWICYGVGGLSFAGALVTGVLAVRTHEEFLMRAQDDPDVGALIHRGRALSLATDALGAVALTGVVLGTVMLLRAAAPGESSAGRVVSAMRAAPGAVGWAF